MRVKPAKGFYSFFLLMTLAALPSCKVGQVTKSSNNSGTQNPNPGVSDPGAPAAPAQALSLSNFTASTDSSTNHGVSLHLECDKNLDMGVDIVIRRNVSDPSEDNLVAEIKSSELKKGCIKTIKYTAPSTDPVAFAVTYHDASKGDVEIHSASAHPSDKDAPVRLPDIDCAAGDQHGSVKITMKHDKQPDYSAVLVQDTAGTIPSVSCSAETSLKLNGPYENEASENLNAGSLNPPVERAYTLCFDDDDANRSVASCIVKPADKIAPATPKAFSAQSGSDSNQINLSWTFDNVDDVVKAAVISASGAEAPSQDLCKVAFESKSAYASFSVEQEVKETRTESSSGTYSYRLCLTDASGNISSLTAQAEAKSVKAVAPVAEVPAEEPVKAAAPVKGGKVPVKAAAF